MVSGERVELKTGATWIGNPVKSDLRLTTLRHIINLGKREVSLLVEPMEQIQTGSLDGTGRNL